MKHKVTDGSFIAFWHDKNLMSDNVDRAIANEFNQNATTVFNTRVKATLPTCGKKKTWCNHEVTKVKKKSLNTKTKQ